ncbi:MAG: trypsin-like serine protease [Gemmatimonadetes bacterium]|nr:trypsin-like serine protease [Gemmatimonadota bacterium]
MIRRFLPGALVVVAVLTAATGLHAQNSDRANASLDTGRRNAIVRAAERVGPAVVTVSVLRTQLVEGPAFPQQSEFFYPFFQNLRRRYWQQVQGIGSGVIVSGDGVVVTNYHVLKGARDIKVTLADGREFKARYLGGEELYDLAFLRLDADGAGLPVASLEESEEVLIGEWVVAIGNPFGYLLDDPQPTVTVGVVSATGRDILSEREGSDTIYKDMIQTDDAINPGNSGGALANALGEVIGINTFIFSRSGGSHGIGFAMPVGTVRRVMDEIINHGQVREVWVGVRIQEIPAALAESLDLGSTEGVIVASVDEGSPADTAGLRRGDVVLEIGDDVTRNFEDARRALYGRLVGDRVRFLARRGSDVKEYVLKLVERE